MKWMGLTQKIGLTVCALIVAGAGCVSKPSPTLPAATCTNSLHMRFVRIPAGDFVMGSPPSEPLRSENELPHRVRISRPFYLGVTHVTIGQFAGFVQATGYQTAAERQGWANGAWNLRATNWTRLYGGSWKNPGFPQDTNHPVVCVTWHDAVAFCDWLSAKEGRKYRLPTEAEWEYACRAGKRTAYIWGDNPDAGSGWANGSDQTAKDLFTLFPSFNWSDGYRYTSPVASFRPNAWGLYDMLGNALQWCGDWYGPYPQGPVADPTGAVGGTEKILRGGSFIYGPQRCRCAFRGRNRPDFENFYVGFRVLLEK
jgi:formylglycine-generating enzyme